MDKMGEVDIVDPEPSGLAPLQRSAHKLPARRIPVMPSPEFQTVLAMLQQQMPSENATVEQLRAGIELLAQLFPVPPDVSCEKVRAGSVPCEWVDTPGIDPQRVVIYLHGGGYMIGSPNSHRDLAQRLSRAARARVLVVDYRLAPEHPYPAAVEDALAAYRWLLGAGFRPERTAIAGDSAGGGLTVALLVAIRDAKLALPAAGVCLSPWTDMEASGESYQTRAALDPMLKRGEILRFAQAYLDGQDPRLPLASPVYADLSGLPPLLIHVGTAEVLYDDSTRLAERARQAGVDVTLEPWEDMIHVWHAFAPILPEGQQAIERIGEFVRQKAA